MTEIASMRQEWSNLDLDFRRIKNLVMINKTKGIYIYHLQKKIKFFSTHPQKFEMTRDQTVSSLEGDCDNLLAGASSCKWA